MSDDIETDRCVRCDYTYELPQLVGGICVDCREAKVDVICGTSKAPPGWYCTRPVHDSGPCAAHPIEGHDNLTFMNCLSVSCPCVHVSANVVPCGGTLRSDGRNVPDDLTFLSCDECGCTYVAEDKRK